MSLPQLFDINMVATLTGRSTRCIFADVKAGKLTWSHRVGRRNAIDAAGLAAYIESMRREPAPPPAPRPPRQRKAPDPLRSDRQGRIEELAARAAARAPLFGVRT